MLDEMNLGNESTEIIVFPRYSPVLLSHLGEGYPFQIFSINPPLLDHIISRILGVDSFHVTIWEGDELAGIVTYEKISKHNWFGENVYVKPEFRGKGYAAYLYRCATKELVSRGAKLIASSVAETNLPSLKSVMKISYGFHDVTFRQYRVSGSDLSEELETGNIQRIPLTNDALANLYRVYSDVMGAEWVKYMVDNMHDSVRDFRHYSPSFFTRFLKQTTVYCDPSDFYSGYLVISNWRSRSQATALFYSGVNETSFTKSKMILLNGLRHIFDRKKVVWLTIFESPRSHSIDLSILPKSPHHKIFYRFVGESGII